ncbi:aromatic amino acid lyase [Solicola sp. PLA-1-18]|uniref:aromatic amino acid lyase n=1 Tax=Solicola sp. PLA-1-18 TaxID=3380532 RepID=UPI003B7A150C
MASHLPLEDLAAWAVEGGPAPVVLTDDGYERISAAWTGLRAAGRSGAVYGLTTGVGALRNVPTEITGDDNASHPLRLWRSHAGGFGATYDDATARAAMAIRLHQITSGRSGVSTGLASALGAAVATGSVPDLHRCGSIGTGDLVPLAELALTLVGERAWRSGGVPVAEVDDGDALPFMSSNALTLATSVLALRRLTDLAAAAERVTALSAAALQASLQAYDPRVHAGRPDAGQAQVAARLMTLLGAGHAAPARIQDPFGLRTVPQVHAPFLDSLQWTERAIRLEVDDPSENPLVVEDGTPLHHGGFVTARLSAALDSLRQATYPVLALSSSRLSALTNPSLTGLPAFLASGPVGSSGVMILEYLAQDALAQARTLTTPVSTGHAVVSLGLEEHASFSTQAALWSEHLVEHASVVLACELVAAVRALRTDPERLPDTPVREVFDLAAAHLSDDRTDRPLGADVERAVGLVRAGLA